MKIDLACGNKKQEGFIGVDFTKEGTQADIVWDLEEFPWPFEDNSVSEIICSHYIEHTSDLISFMNECWRIMNKEATIKITSPYYSSVGCWQDPTHKRAISEETFSYFDKEWRIKSNLTHYPIITDFKRVSFDYLKNPEFIFTKENDFRYAVRHYNNVIDEITIILKK